MNELIKYFNENYSKNNYIIKNKKLDRYYLWNDINDFMETGILKSEGLKEYGNDDYLKYCMIKIEDELPDTMYLNLLADNEIYNGIFYKTKESDSSIRYESLGEINADLSYGYLIFDTPLINATITITKKNLTFPKLNYPKSTIQIYKAYQIIKSYGIKNDEKLNELFNKVKLPQPKTIEENELYANCLYDLDDSSLYGIDKFELLKDCPYMRKCEGGYGYCYTIFEGDFSVINNPVYIDVELEYISYEENTEGELTTYKDRLFYNENYGELENFSFISTFRSALTDGWEYKENKFGITINKTDNSIFFYVDGSNKYVEKATLTIYQAKSDEQIYTSQIYNLDAQKLINKEEGLKDFAKKRDTILNGSVRLIADNDPYYYEDTVGENSCSFGNDALGDFSFTINGGSAKGKYSFAAGQTYSHGDYQFTLGKYNITDEENKYIVIIGNGKQKNYHSFDYSNAHTLDWNGNGWYAGKLSQEGTPTEDKDLITKKYFDDTRKNIPLIYEKSLAGDGEVFSLKGDDNINYFSSSQYLMGGILHIEMIRNNRRIDIPLTVKAYSESERLILYNTVPFYNNTDKCMEYIYVESDEKSAFDLEASNYMIGFKMKIKNESGTESTATFDSISNVYFENKEIPNPQKKIKQ